MALTGLLAIFALSGIAYGTIKKNRKILYASIILLIAVGTLLAIYAYLYSQNPY